MAAFAAPARLLDADLDPAVCQRALHSRDPRLDGLFFVGITTTRIYCRPVCPARVTYADRRRFFNSAGAAERAGYRPCLRCRPELAPGRALCDAVPRLALAAATRIAAGGLNGRSVAALARELCVSERHLRRALEREFGVSPIELAQTHRLLLAKQLLADTDLPITRIAFASGFQSLRRFNTAFREQYRLSPSSLRRSRRNSSPARADVPRDLVRLTLAYRPPLAWSTLLGLLRRDSVRCVERIDGDRYARTVRLGDARGLILLTNGTRNAINVDVTSSLVPELMPLLARIRQLLDLDAEPSVIDAHLAQAGLGELVAARPGLRIPGALDGFEIALRVLLSAPVVQRVFRELGEPIETNVSGLDRLAPDAAQIACAGAATLMELGVRPELAATIMTVAKDVLNGSLALRAGSDVHAALDRLRTAGIPEDPAQQIVMRALHWPDAFPASDPHAERWRPWRAYAALHLSL